MFKVITNLSAPGPVRTVLLRHPAVVRPRNYKRILVRLLGTLVLLGLLSRLNLNYQQIGQDLSHANLWAVAGSVGLIFPIIGLKALRWKYILKNYGINISRKEATALYGLGLAAGSVTPGQAGDFIKALYLQDKGYSLSRGMVATLLDRLFDMFVLVLLALGGLLQLGSLFYGNLPLLLSFLALTGLGILVVAVPPLFNFVFNNLLRKALAWPLARALGKITGTGQLKGESPVPPAMSLEGATAVPYRPLAPWPTGTALFLTLVTACLAVARTWLLALALGVNLPVTTALAVSSLATIASLVPVTISGIGVRDLALVSIMTQLGYPGDIAVSLSTLLLLVNLLNFPAGYIAFRTRPELV